MNAGSETASFTSTIASACDRAGNTTPDKDLRSRQCEPPLWKGILAVRAGRPQSITGASATPR